MTTLNPYLTFNGNCEEAFNFYKSVFGGEFAFIGRFKDMKSDQPPPEKDAEKIMHVSLPVGKGTVLMGSDTIEEYGLVTPGSNFSISVSGESKEEADRLFNGLAEGGKIIMPIADAFWGAYFGMVKDKFDIQWMVSYDYNRQQ